MARIALASSACSVFVWSMQPKKDGQWLNMSAMGPG